MQAMEEAIALALAELAQNQVLARIWDRDHTVWKPGPAEISNRLGWQHSPEEMLEDLGCLEDLVAWARRQGYKQALLLGMGGSSLAPWVLRQSLGVARGYLDLAVLDTTDPTAVLAQAEQLDLRRTLFIVSSKSGGTVETISAFKFFYNRVAEALGTAVVGQHFVAITDPHTSLDALADEYGFGATLRNNPEIGGRYAALSYVGLVPAALMGVDLRRLLHSALDMARRCGPSVEPRENPAARIGATLAAWTRTGRDKLTLVTSEGMAGFGEWVEQLIAESTGKEGCGILPVVGEPLGEPQVYGEDRAFVHIKLGPDARHEQKLAVLERVGHPVVSLELSGAYDLGGQFFLWELATAVAGYFLRINPFDQPNVEAAKAQARRLVAEHAAKGSLPRPEAAPFTAEALCGFLGQARRGDYIALLAYVQPTRETDARLQELRVRLRDRYRLATTTGFGPRYLHSTGQLHKGDAGRGLFVMLTADDPQDAPIPDEPGATASAITFGVLKRAQALGDELALLEAQRRVIRFHLGGDAPGELERLATWVS